VAGEKSPPMGLGEGVAGVRGKVRAAWDDWFKNDGVKLDLAKLDLENRQLGFTLGVAWNGENCPNGRIFELDKKGRVRWSFDNVQHPVDGHLVRGDRVLVAEHSGRRVTDRDFKGKILWEHKVQDSLVSCKRLANGNTWVVTYQRIVEVTPDGKEVFGFTPPGNGHGFISHAEKLRNGNVAYLGYSGKIFVINPSGKELRNFAVDPGQNGLVKFEALTNGNFIV